jgi:hypothetical protein
MNFDEIIKKLSSGDMPTAGMAGVGILLLLVAWKVGKAVIKVIFFLLALALFAGAVWWHLHNR